MNKIALVIVSAALSTALMAQTTTAPATDTAKAKTHAAAKKEPVISGTLTSIDAIGNTIVIKTKAKEDTLTVDSSTVVKSSGKAVKLGDLASGVKVTAAYKEENGKKVATKITAKVEKAPAKEPAAK